MTNQTIIWMAVSFLLLTGLSQGGYDISGSTEATNLSLSQFNSVGLGAEPQQAVMQTGAPEATADVAGTELAAYTDQAPPAADLGTLQSANLAANYPMYIYYDGSYVGWNAFTSTFPTDQPGLWVERAAGWSWYATLPLGGWTQELLYAPAPTPVTLYEIYPSGYAMSYNLGFVQPGYYTIWYYADSPGRHTNVFATNSGFSNMVVIDVYSPQPPKPTPPSPKQQCESNPLCSWANGQCLCRGWNPDNPEKEKCEENPTCDWFNGHCYCRGFNPEDPEKEKCEQNSLCNWVNGQCLCTGLIPDDNPEKQQCEQNPECSWANGQCLCRGLNPPEPEPMPGPTPEPTPSPNPARESCEQNPSCSWANGRCLCTGFGASASGGPDESEGLLGSEQKNPDELGDTA